MNAEDLQGQEVQEQLATIDGQDGQEEADATMAVEDGEALLKVKVEEDVMDVSDVSLRSY